MINILDVVLCRSSRTGQRTRGNEQDLQAALGTIEWDAEEQLEMLKDRKRQLKTSDMKPQLVGQVEVDEEASC